MDVKAHSERLEAILPLIMRTIYPPREDDPFADLPLMQLRVVRTLAPGKRPLSELGEELQMSASRLAHLVSRLESVGLVRKSCHEQDRRVKFAELTEAAQAHMQTHMRLRSSRAQELLSALSEEERLVLLGALESLYRRAKDLAPVASEVMDARSIA